MNNDSTHAKSLAHTKWNCKYHIVFAPKYRRKIFFEEKRLAIRDIIRECKIVCVKSNCADLFYAPYWGKQLKGWISNGKT